MSKHCSCFSGARTYLNTSSLPFPGGGIVGPRGESDTPGHWIIAGSDSAKNSPLWKNGASGVITDHRNS